MAKKFNFIVFTLSIIVFVVCIILHQCRIVIMPEKSPFFFFGICCAVIVVLQILLLLGLIVRKAKGTLIVLNLLVIVFAGMMSGLFLIHFGSTKSVELCCENQHFLVTKYRNTSFDAVAITTPCNSFCSKLIVSQNVEVMGKPIQDLVAINEDSERDVFVITYSGKNKSYSWDIRKDDLKMINYEKAENEININN